MRTAGSFKNGPDPRRGRGPARGAPNAGRPPSELRGLAQRALEDVIPRLRAIALSNDSDDGDVIRAILALHKISGMERLEISAPDSQTAAIVVMPTPVSALEWSAAAQRHQAESGSR